MNGDQPGKGNQWEVKEGESVLCRGNSTYEARDKRRSAQTKCNGTRQEIWLTRSAGAKSRGGVGGRPHARIWAYILGAMGSHLNV